MYSLSHGDGSAHKEMAFLLICNLVNVVFHQ